MNAGAAIVLLVAALVVTCVCAFVKATLDNRRFDQRYGTDDCDR